ncbi:MAG: 2Fe-2S iron-sulfur cluster binding domain-containing protein [Cohaesibacteraceae bacterium]|nr:2Fe-2S iron-sulfur cluster binding domain-containing protein [Cohaesibacteraceae bacterium]
MQVFAHKTRPVHFGSFPMEKLGRGSRALMSGVKSDGLLIDEFAPTDLGRSISEFLCAIDAAREGSVAPDGAEVPDDLQERSNHLKSAGYFIDSTLMGVAPLRPEHMLAQPHQHPGLATLSFQQSKEKLRLRFNPLSLIRQMEQAIDLAKSPINNHTHALVIVNDYPRDPDEDEFGTDWFKGLQPWRAAVRAGESACVLANYLRILGFEARAHSATTSEVNLHKLAVEAGLALPAGKGIENPFIGDRFEVAVVTTTMALAPDMPLREQTAGDLWRAKGPKWWMGAAAPKTPKTTVDMTGRPYEHSRYPTEKLKRVEKTTTFIDEDRVPRVPKSSEMFLRAAFGDLGKPSQNASKDGHSVSKAPLAGALRLALNVYSLLQRGDAAPERVQGYEDTRRNAALMKATMHWLGADIAGLSEAPAWVWYSHRQDGTRMSVDHPMAASVMIDQGFETMDGASGDDWISSAQSMRTYMRAALVCGVLGQHVRNLGYSATAHSAADSDVIHTPLVLLAGLGEVSRIGESILNPFLGPRVKTGILTTDFPMQFDKPIDFGLQNFCNSCNKCARECPAGAISSGDKVMFNGYEIWKADTAKCTQYRTTNLGGAMCGRCLKTCPWNLAGLVQERPFRWAAMHVPRMASWLAQLDDRLNRGTINPSKKWWWDIARDQKDGKIKQVKQSNTRGLNKHIDLKREDQTLAMYPVDLVPPPLPMPWPLEREKGIVAYENALTPREYQDKQASGDTHNLVSKPRPADVKPPVIVAKITRRWQSSVDGKVDLFEISTRDGTLLPEWNAGAHVDVTVTPQFIRQFSLAGDPKDRTKYQLGILREDQGRGGSLKIHHMLHEGAPVIVSQPRNHFPVAKTEGRHILLAGGIGVTPLIAMGHELARDGAQFELYYKAKTRRQAGFIPELEAVSWVNHVHFHFSDEARLDIETVLNDYKVGDHVYTCGPAAFMDAVFETSERLGWPEDALHREYFSIPEEGDWENKDFEIELASTGAIIPVSADQKVTEALETVGISVDVKCSDGLCGVCSTRYLSGDVEHRDYVLSKAQQSEKMILCCSRAREEGGRIRLDL